MAEKEASYQYSESNSKLRDLEEKQNILKDRVLLIGENLLEFKEKNVQDILELKKQVQIINQEMEKMKTLLSTIANEFSNLARKDDLEILQKQAKMFQPYK